MNLTLEKGKWQIVVRRERNVFIWIPAAGLDVFAATLIHCSQSHRAAVIGWYDWFRSDMQMMLTGCQNPTSSAIISFLCRPELCGNELVIPPTPLVLPWYSAGTGENQGAGATNSQVGTKQKQNCPTKWTSTKTQQIRDIQNTSSDNQIIKQVVSLDSKHLPQQVGASRSQNSLRFWMLKIPTHTDKLESSSCVGPRCCVWARFFFLFFNITHHVAYFLGEAANAKTRFSPTESVAASMLGAAGPERINPASLIVSLAVQDSYGIVKVNTVLRGTSTAADY